MNNKIFIIIVGLIAAGSLGMLLLAKDNSGYTVAPRLGEQYEEMGNKHVLPSEIIGYNSLPATSGDHNAQRTPYRIFDSELSDYNSLHGLEHGAIAFWYNVDTVSEEEVKQLEDFYATLPPFENGNPKAYLSPRSDLDDDVKVAMTAWTYLLNQPDIDFAQMQAFFDGHLAKGPEAAP